MPRKTGLMGCKIRKSCSLVAHFTSIKFTVWSPQMYFITSVISLSVGLLYFTAGCRAPGDQYLYFNPFHTLVGGGQWETGSSPVWRRLFFSLDVTRGGVTDWGVVTAAAGVGSGSDLVTGNSVLTPTQSASLACV